MSENADAALRRPRVVGLNHIALEVGDVDAALAFYGRIFSFTLRGRQLGAAFIDMGDQFIALIEGVVLEYDQSLARTRLRPAGLHNHGLDPDCVTGENGRRELHVGQAHLGDNRPQGQFRNRQAHDERHREHAVDQRPAELGP